MPLVVKNLIIINALFFLARYTLASTLNIDLNSVLGLYYYNSPEFNPYQLISYMFMHGASLIFSLICLPCGCLVLKLRIYGDLKDF